MREEWLSDDVRLICGDCRDILPTLGKVDAVVTSPPYDNIRDYGAAFTTLDWKPVFDGLKSCVNLGGVVVWNVADQTVDGSETGTSFEQALYAKKIGFRIHDTMIYCKEGVTFPDANRYHPAFEYMFVFSNGIPRYFNGLCDWRNKWAGTKAHGSGREKDGTTTAPDTRKVIPEFGLRRNWWVISNPQLGQSGGHPAPMPYSMASDHIETWTVGQQIILDPFMGSGTTGVAAVRLGRKFIGIEIDPGYFDISCRRISDELSRPRLNLEPPPKPVQESLL